MQVVCEAFVFQKIKYSESAVIVKAICKDFGLKSFFVNGARSSKAKHKSALFQPMNLLEIAFDKRETSDLLKPQSVQLIKGIQESGDPLKQCMAFFMADLIRSCIHHMHEEAVLFDFLQAKTLEIECSSSLSLFPHQLLLDFSRFLGIFPSFSNEKLFDIREGEFVDYISGFSFSEEASDLLKQILIKKELEFTPRYVVRKELLDGLLRYYQFHIDDFVDLPSIEILKTVLRD